MTTTRPTATTRVDRDRRATSAAGWLYIATFVFSIPALALYDGVVNDDGFVLGVGSPHGVAWGGLIEVITALAGIGTAVVLYPILRRHGRAGAVGFVASRTLEAAMIFTGVLSVMSVLTLRQDLAGTADPAALTTTAEGFVAMKDWSFLLGPGVMPAINALCFATILYRSRLVPRIMPALGLIGAPILLASSTATLFGAQEQVSVTAMLFALPIAAWELSIGIWMIVKGFRTDEGSEPVVTDERPVPTAFQAAVA